VMLRRGALAGLHRAPAASFAASRAGGVVQISVAAATRRFKTVTVQQDPLEYEFPRENPAAGLSYALNWSLCKFNVVPQGKSFRNLKAPELAKAGGTAKTDVPQVVPYDKAMETEVQNALGAETVTRYVWDCALGALAANEVPVRIISDSPAAALAFHTLCSRTKALPLPEVNSPVSVLHISSLPSVKGPTVTVNPQSKQIIMVGSIHSGVLVEKLTELCADEFLSVGVLPLLGPGDAGGTAFCSPGGAAGAAKLKHGSALSPAGYCRLFMGSATADGKVKDEYTLMPNQLEAPKAVILYANDATGTIPAASKLSPEQAAFYFAAACAPKGVTRYGKAAETIMSLGGMTQFYMVNKAAFAKAEDADAAAKGLAGTKGKITGVLGLEEVEVKGSTLAAPSADAAKAAAKSFVAAVGARCKGMDAVISAGPKIEEEKK